jgi:hypothetical protein
LALYIIETKGGKYIKKEKDPQKGKNTLQYLKM